MGSTERSHHSFNTQAVYCGNYEQQGQVEGKKEPGIARYREIYEIKMQLSTTCGQTREEGARQERQDDSELERVGMSKKKIEIQCLIMRQGLSDFIAVDQRSRADPSAPLRSWG